jgi:hypothetical protein
MGRTRYYRLSTRAGGQQGLFAFPSDKLDGVGSSSRVRRRVRRRVDAVHILGQPLLFLLSKTVNIARVKNFA